MTLPKYKEIDFLSTISDIDQELFIQQKNLLDLKIKKATNKKINCHLFTHTKRKIAQLKFKKSVILKTKI
jgi:ribosomal protein L29